MLNRWAIGGAVLLAVTAGGLGTVIYNDLSATDRDLEKALERLVLVERLLEADILDGTSYLGVYTGPLENGEQTVAALRANHPIGGLLRAGEIDKIEARYKALRRNYELYS